MRYINAFLAVFCLGLVLVFASIAAVGYAVNGWDGMVFFEVFGGPVAGIAAMIAYDRLTRWEFVPTNGKIR